MKIFLQVFVSMIICILCISGLKSDDPRISSHLFSEFESIKTNPAQERRERRERRRQLKKTLLHTAHTQDLRGRDSNRETSYREYDERERGVF